jgi:hypothetical protein
MTTTISVKSDTLARFHELKDELDDAQDGVPDHTADSFLSALLDTWEAAGEGYYASNDTLVEPDDVADAVADRVNTTSDVTLDASERRKIAEEVAEVLR